jgi:flagellar protein FliL
MADDNKEETKEADAESSAAGAKKKKKSKKALVLLILLPILLIAGVGGGLFLGGFIGAKPEEEKAEVENVHPAEGSFFFDLPEMLINLSTNGKKPSYLKLKLSLVLQSQEDLSHVETVLPLIVDQYQVYLRGLHVDDLQGSAGMQRLREELLMRADLVAKPIKVRDVLFSQMLVQ